jgi:hypothetical protein
VVCCLRFQQRARKYCKLIFYQFEPRHGSRNTTDFLRRQTSSRINLTSAAGPNTSMLPCGRS